MLKVTVKVTVFMVFLAAAEKKFSLVKFLTHPSGVSFLGGEKKKTNSANNHLLGY